MYLQTEKELELIERNPAQMSSKGQQKNISGRIDHFFFGQNLNLLSSQRDEPENSASLKRQSVQLCCLLSETAVQIARLGNKIVSKNTELVVNRLLVAYVLVPDPISEFYR